MVDALEASNYICNPIHEAEVDKLAHAGLRYKLKRFSSKCANRGYSGRFGQRLMFIEAFYTANKSTGKSDSC